MSAHDTPRYYGEQDLIPVITQCCVEALYKLGREHQRVIDLAKRFERRKCNHREAIEPNECLKDVVGECTEQASYSFDRIWRTSTSSPPATQGFLEKVLQR